MTPDETRLDFYLFYLDKANSKFFSDLTPRGGLLPGHFASPSLPPGATANPAASALLIDKPGATCGII